jgi:BR serine/threonine kinase
VHTKQVAVKILKKEMLLSKPSLHKKVQREIAILKLIDHPNVLKLYGALFPPPKVETFLPNHLFPLLIRIRDTDVYETTKYLFIIMEFVEGGELFEYLVARGSLDTHEALRFF